MARLLKIIATPPGEAPLWVREAWIGTTVPLAQRGNTPLRFPTAGVITGPQNTFGFFTAWLRGQLVREAGYLVEVVPAVEALAKNNPAAAQLWRENTPHLVRPRRCFVFQQGVGQVIEGAAA